MTDHDRTDEYRVPEAAAAAACDRCGRPFPEERLLALHRRLAHEDDLSAAEAAAAESAASAESAAVRVFRLKALVALVALYFGFLFAYSIVG